MSEIINVGSEWIEVSSGDKYYVSEIKNASVTYSHIGVRRDTDNNEAVLYGHNLFLSLFLRVFDTTPTAQPDGAQPDTPAPGSYKRAKGVLPLKEGDPDPDEGLRRMRGHLPEWDEFDRLRASRSAAQSELAAEREAHAETWRHADGLGIGLEGITLDLHQLRGHSGSYKACLVQTCKQNREALAAIDALAMGATDTKSEGGE